MQSSKEQLRINQISYHKDRNFFFQEEDKEEIEEPQEV